MHRRTRRTLWVVAAVLLVLAVALFLRSKAPPEAARLLPDSDGILYVNFKPIRVFMKKKLKPPKRDPEYQDFVDATGVDWEQDLDQAAVALHRMQDPKGPNGPVAYSLVLVGNLTGKKFNAWLESKATSRESYAGHTIYSIASQNRVVRVAQIGYDMIGVSNYPGPEMIRSILDRHRTAALPFAGSTLLTEHYHDIPLLSLAWGVGQIGLPFSESGAIHILGFALPIQDDSTLIVSAAPTLAHAGSVNLKVEEIAPSDDAATSQAATLATLITMARGFSAPLPANPANEGLKQVLQTAEVNRKDHRVIVTASLSQTVLSQFSQAIDADSE
jgi:hypothetical protein